LLTDTHSCARRRPGVRPRVSPRHRSCTSALPTISTADTATT